ncbi:MAG: dodecin domain-containing protein [Rhodothermales bacterium]|nr:dodecin domain-containing protein [Rhodothermales bacterium]
MSVAKVLEIIAEGKTIDEAVEDAANEAAKSVRNVRSVNVDNIQALVEDGKVKKYRVNCKVTFVIE